MIHQLLEIIYKIPNFLESLKIEHITLISVFVTFIIYSLGKRNELNMKRHEAKKENYVKFLDLHIKLLKDIRENKNKKISQYDEKFFDVGSSLLAFGSKKLYRKYLFYREINTNPLLVGNEYFEDGELNLYLLGGILKQIRKELSLEINNTISEIEALSFFVNGFAGNPAAKAKLAQMKHRIRMFKLELFFFERWQFIYSIKFYYFSIAPIKDTLKLVIKYFIQIPIGKVILKIFPSSKIFIKQ